MTAELPLCLLTPDTQTRHIIESLLRGAAGNPRITLESDSLTVLCAHVRTGAWVSIVPEKFAESTRMTREFNAIPIVEPEVGYTIGMAMPLRDPMSPLAAALAAEARRTAANLMATPRS
jgi:DNA-binding transcriptional LysR family regulator